MKKVWNLFVISVITALLYSSPVVFATDTADTAATGEELAAWMETHMDAGGTVTLTDDVSLDEDYTFSASRPGKPTVVVDAAGFTIQVTGEVVFQSDNHLVLRGKSAGGVLRAMPGGLLSLSGLAVETEKEGVPALVQEEGAGLTLENCSVTGDVRFARTPFVIYKNSATVLAETGQTAADVLPGSMKCHVNRQGEVYSEEVPVSWEMAGTESLQAERKRFVVQGCYELAASREPPECTVVYVDHPLTFTTVETSVSRTGYVIWGWFTMPEELPVQVSEEYSFDNENWNVYEVNTYSGADEGFTFYVSKEEWESSSSPYLYLRLSWDNEGTMYYSNVLRFAAEDISRVVDLGGSRGGGTAIIPVYEDPVPKSVEEQPGASAKPTDSPESPAGEGKDTAPEGTGTDTAPEGNTKPVSGKTSDKIQKSSPDKTMDTGQKPSPDKAMDTGQNASSDKTADVNQKSSSHKTSGAGGETDSDAGGEAASGGAFDNAQTNHVDRSADTEPGEQSGSASPGRKDLPVFPTPGGWLAAVALLVVIVMAFICIRKPDWFLRWRKTWRKEDQGAKK